MKHALEATITSLALLCAGCATHSSPPPISQASYYAIPLGPDAFRIAYRGNESVPAESHLDRMLRQACQVTKERACSHFAVIDEDSTIPRQVVYCAGLNHYNLNPDRGVLVQCFAEKPKRMFSFDCGKLEKVLNEKLNINR